MKNVIEVFEKRLVEGVLVNKLVGYVKDIKVDNPYNVSIVSADVTVIKEEALKFTYYYNARQVARVIKRFPKTQGLIFHVARVEEGI